MSAERQVPAACPHCGVSVVLASAHCRGKDGGQHPTCTWAVCPCRAHIDPAGRHTHPEHGRDYRTGERCDR